MSRKVLDAVAFISAQNHPILVHTFSSNAIKYHYIAHTSLDVIEERVAAGGKTTECYLGLLYAMQDVAVYGYITPLKVKIVIALALSDSVVRDMEINLIFKALHMAYYSAVSNPFNDGNTDVSRSKSFRRRIEEISKAVGNPI
ncbi:Sedlin [Roridomyces roridus]|uniref:Trafficking protein particle complex subunit 2-like protein n=1 Tax=Roridomyces roridus TaxID=1738132 RepID=A0AAD7C4A8_9AGAR|nr:Sedlin [Roridomyces roridus]